MKKTFSILISVLAVVFCSCDNWLEIYPQNDQVSDYYWTSKEDVEAMLNGGYYYLREMVTTELIPLGELRAGHLYNRRGSNLQEFRIKETDKSLSNWGPFYEVINIANAILRNADKAMANDDTYDENMLNSHKAEAYFLRSLCYFYLVRNWRDVPLVLEPYEDDSYSYKLPQSNEDEVIAQIKQDLTTVINSGSAKEHFDKTWETKGRATKWAVYALMADVCLWNGDYSDAEYYCDLILESKSPYAPKFLSTPSHASWFSIFNPGNSNESIFELQWDEEEEQLNNLPYLFDISSNSQCYQFSQKLTEMFAEEYRISNKNMAEAVRSLYGGFYILSPTAYETATTSYCWKYFGSEVLTEKRTPDHYDPHFIIYRVAEIILIKAEALTMQGSGRWAEAIEGIDLLRQRSNLDPCGIQPESTNEADLLECILDERAMELCGEGKAWYDMLRIGKRDHYKYKDSFIVGRLLDFNTQASASWFRSVLMDNDALYLPVWEDELENNTLLKQNPYYE